jgi:hypothetical protein
MRRIALALALAAALAGCAAEPVGDKGVSREPSAVDWGAVRRGVGSALILLGGGISAYQGSYAAARDATPITCTTTRVGIHDVTNCR